MMNDVVNSIVDRYIPPRMYDHRRKMAQELYQLVYMAHGEGDDDLALELASQPLWKRIWVAITKDY